MFRGARYLGDDLLHRLPARPFRDLGDYFRWMFGGLTSTGALPPGDAYDYKNADVACLVGALRCLSSCMRARGRRGNLNDGGSVRLVARSGHFVYSPVRAVSGRALALGYRSSPPCPRCCEPGTEQGGLEALFEQADAQRLHRGARAGLVLPMPTCCAQPAMPSRPTRRYGGVGAAVGLLRNLHRSRGPGEAMGLAALARVARSGHRFGVGRCAGALPLPTGRGGSRRRTGRRRTAMARLCALRGGNRRDRRGPHAALVAPGRGTPEMRRAQVCRQRAVLS